MDLLSMSQIASWWRTQSRVQKLGQFDGNQHTRTKKIKNDVRWRPSWIPVMADPGGDLIVLDLDPGPAGSRGQLFQWYNNGAQAMRVCANSFREWLDGVAEQLLARRFELDDFGGIQLQSSPY
jgi:cell wall assembly regulator SMI1